MIDLIRKLTKDFLEIDPELSVQKAFELLSDPKINTLIFRAGNAEEFFYLTDLIINNSYKNRPIMKDMKCGEIAERSIIFNYDDYQNNSSGYLQKFKSSLNELNNSTSKIILVTSKNEPIGLVSDLVFTNLADENNNYSISALDYFIKDDPEPLRNISLFYKYINNLGFELNNEVKDYIKEKLIQRMTERVKSEIIPQLDDLIAQSIKKTGSTINNQGTKHMNSNGNGNGTDIGISNHPNSIQATSVGMRSDSKGVAIIYNPNHINHKPVGSSPETPERLTKIIALIKDREKIFNNKCRMVSDYEPATENDILKVHTKQYVEFIKNYALKGGGFLGDSTYLTKQTHELALLAVGGAFRAADEVINGRAEFSIGLIRPPGHHASKDKYGGYCIYNNAAILARHLQSVKGMKKILILDWDAHAANGTMEIFYNDPTVMVISLHQDPHNFYPKTGFISQMGKQYGLGYTINVEMPRGSGDNEYLEVFHELVIPLYEKHKPDFVIGCNGFDAHHSDPYTDLQLTATGYYEFCKIFRKYMMNKMVILMEGGYNPYMGELTHTLINGLLNRPKPFEDKFHSLATKVVSSEKTHKVLLNNIKEIKFNLDRYNIL